MKNRIRRHALLAAYSAIICSLFLMAFAGCGGSGGGGNGSGGSAENINAEPPPGPQEPVTYSIKGTVTSDRNVISDSDVNDPYADDIPNDDFSQAQQVFVPCSISGYVNLPGAGPDGASFNDGDLDDYYQVTLTDGLSLVLYQTEDSNSADLNLYLYDSEQNLVDVSVSDDDIESVIFSAGDGTYYVRVAAAESASPYILTIGYPGFLSVSSSLRLSDDFAPGEVLVRLDEADSEMETNTVLAEATENFAAMGFDTKSGTNGRERLLKRSSAIDRITMFKRLGIQEGFARSLSQGKVDAETEAKMETLWMVRALRKQPGIQYAEPNYILKALSTEPNDTFYSYQWHYPDINLPEAWDITTGSSDVVVAVVDSGVLLAHPDLAGQLVDGYDFISDPDTSMDGDGVDDNPDDPGDSEEGESSFHGTSIAGVIGATSDNHTGVAGVTWQAGIMPLRALGYGGAGTMSDILEAVKYAAGLETNIGITLDEPVDIINLSLGSTAYSAIAESVYAQVREQGVIVVAAAGNEKSDNVIYPAGYETVVAVGATAYDDTRASYSSYGPAVDVAAPGGDSRDVNHDGYIDGVLSTWGDDSNGSIEMWYLFRTGTSMAAPHVAGVAALMKSLYPGLTPDEFDALLQGGYLTIDLGDPGRDDEFGYGLIDAHQAVLVAQEGTSSGSLPKIPYANPDFLNFGSSMTGSEVTVTHIGNGELVIDDYSWNASWLTVSPLYVDAAGIGTYRVEVDREGLAGGIYTDTVTFAADNGSDAQMYVAMWVGNASGTAASGYYSIIIVDPDSMTGVGQYNSTGENGVYEYSFSDLLYGDTYFVYAGTDSNNDGYICDSGEIGGAYSSLNSLTAVTVNGDIENIDFSTHAISNLFNGASSNSSERQKIEIKP